MGGRAHSYFHRRSKPTKLYEALSRLDGNARIRIHKSCESAKGKV